MELLYKEITEKVIGSAFEVYRELGYGFLEKVYKKAMIHELTLQNVMKSLFFPPCIKGFGYWTIMVTFWLRMS